MGTTRTKRTGRSKQQALIDTQLPEHKAIIDLAGEYVEIRDERLELGQLEVAKRDELRELLREAGLAKKGFHVVDPRLGKVDVDIEAVPAVEKVKVRIKPVADAADVEVQ